MSAITYLTSSFTNLFLSSLERRRRPQNIIAILNLFFRPRANPSTLWLSRFHAEHLSFLLRLFTPFLTPLFLLYSILGQQLLFKRKHRHVPIHGHMHGKLRVLKLKGWLSDGKKGSRLRLSFRVVDDVPEKKGIDL